MKLYLIPTLLAPETENHLPGVLTELLPTLKHYLVENERTARRFLSGMKVGLNIQELRFFRLDKKTKAETIETYFKEIPNGADVGVISESGCPGIADPGARAVEWAHRKGIEVVPIPGPSSIFLALMASGMNGQHFHFLGYLPIDKEARKRKIREMEMISAKQRQTQIFIETPYRNDALLKDLLNTLHPTTRLCIASNVTAPDGFVKTRPVQEWKAQKTQLGKIPTVFLVMG